MFLGPFFVAEMRSAARRRRNFLLRALYASGMLFLLWISYLRLFIAGATFATSAQFAGEFFLGFALLQQAAIFLLVPVMVAGAIAQERERRTMEYLLTTHLSASEIVLGKLTSRLLQATMLLLTGFGILAAARLFGGVGARELTHVFGAALVSTIEIGGVSILISTWSHRARDSLRNVYVLLVLWCILPVIPIVLKRFLALPVPAVFGNALPSLAPWSMLAATIQTLDTGEIARLAGLHLLIGAACAAIAIATLRSAYRRHSVVLAHRWWHFPWQVSREAPARLSTQPMGKHPMWWKETFFRRRLHWEVARYGGAALLFSAIYYISYGQGTLLLFPTFAMILTAVLLTSSLLLVTARGASSITVEKERDSWPVVLSTTLSDRAIVLGKVGGAMYSSRGWVAGTTLLWLIAALIDTRNGWGGLAQLAVFAPCCAFCAVLGVRCSLRSSSSISAMCKAAGALLGLNFAYLLLLVPILAAAGIPSEPWMMTACIPFALLAAPSAVTGDPFGLSGNIPLLATGSATLAFFYLFTAAWMLATSIIKFDTWSARTHPRVAT